ncbi:MAG: glycine/sarcosine/betaine reductase selenoprotein B family protein [Actinomycetota bacterium]
MPNADRPESLESFRLSFSYGTRSDLNFKFFKSTTDDDAASFLQELLHRLGDAYDTGDVGPLIEAAYQAQVRGYTPAPGAPPPKFSFEDGPFAPVSTAVENATVGLVTTSGHFVAGDDPQPLGEPAMTQEGAEKRIGELLSSAPSLSEIPSDTPTRDLRVRHGGYDIRSALRDPNVTFPIDRLREADEDGRVGSISSTFFSFHGATSHGKLRQELPAWIERIHAEDVDVMLLVPV